MSDWNDKNDRKEATFNFIKKLNDDPNLRAQCLNDPSVASKTLMDAGGFTNMPTGVEVRVFENSKGALDQVVTIGLPEIGKLPDKETFEGGDVWLCTWNLWDQ